MIDLTYGQYRKQEWRLRLREDDRGSRILPEDLMDHAAPFRGERSVFYVYVYLDPRKQGVYDLKGWKFRSKPFYIGKGVGDRINHTKNEYAERTIRKIEASGMRVKRIKVAEGLTESQAYALERNLIQIVGLANLTNFTVGGVGVRGLKWTDEWKAAKSKEVKAHYASLSDAEKAEYARIRWSKLDREVVAKKQSRTWQTMEKERKTRIVKKRNAAIQAFWNSPAGLLERARRSKLQAQRNRERAKKHHEA